MAGGGQAVGRGAAAWFEGMGQGQGHPVCVPPDPSVACWSQAWEALTDAALPRGWREGKR